MPKQLHIFARLTKVDEAKREVSGLATAEVIDKAGEIFDYETSKPYFKAWSDEIAKATDGKSLGNVREMHQASAVGKLIGIEFDDDKREIPVTAKIIDDAAWQKCLEGVYTGFSIGGSYVKRWKDTDVDAYRFTAVPAEISVVDNPCVGDAHFTAVKVDGSSELRKFKSVEKTDREARKSMYTVGALAAELSYLADMQSSLVWEEEYEGDDSLVPARFAAWIKEGLAILNDLNAEESAELAAALKAVAVEANKTAPAEQQGEDHVEKIDVTKLASAETVDALKKAVEDQSALIKTQTDLMTKLNEKIEAQDKTIEKFGEAFESLLQEPEKPKAATGAAAKVHSFSKVDDQKKPGESGEKTGIDLTKAILKGDVGEVKFVPKGADPASL